MHSQAAGPTTFGTRTGIALKQLFRSGKASSVAVTTWPSALRRGLLIGVLITVATATDQLAAGFAMAIGALNLGLVDGVVPRRSLAKVLALVTVGTGVVCFLSTLAAGTWFSLPLLVLLAYMYGCLAGSGFVAMHAALVTFITGVVFSNTHGDLKVAATNAFFAVLGCLLQMASALIAWRYERRATIQRSLGQLLEALAELVEKGDPSGGSALRAAMREVATEKMISGARLEPAWHEHFSLIRHNANWLRVDIAEWLTQDNVSSTQQKALVQALRILDARLRHTHLHSGDPHQLLTAVEGGDQWRILIDRIDDMSTAIAAPLSNVTTNGSVVDRAEQALSPSERLRPWLTLFTPSGQMARHGLRLAIAIGVAQTLTLAFDLPRGYWLSVTVLICLQPDFATTLTHGAQRVIGTFAGVIFVSGIVFVTGGWTWLLVAVVTVTGVLLMRFTTANYAIQAFFITTFVGSLIESLTAVETTLFLRLLNTFIGFVIALLVYLALPSWKADKVHDLLAKTVDTHQQWIDSLLAGLRSPANTNPDEIRQLGFDARNATLQARPTAEAALLEPTNIKVDPRAQIEVLEAIQSIGVAALAVEATLREKSTELNATDTQPFTTAIDEAFESSAQMVQGQAAEASHQSRLSKALIPKTGDAVCDKALGLIDSSVLALYLASTRVFENTHR